MKQIKKRLIVVVLMLTVISWILIPGGVVFAVDEQIATEETDNTQENTPSVAKAVAKVAESLRLGDLFPDQDILNKVAEELRWVTGKYHDQNTIVTQEDLNKLNSLSMINLTGNSPTKKTNVAGVEKLKGLKRLVFDNIIFTSSEEVWNVIASLSDLEELVIKFSNIDSVASFPTMPKLTKLNIQGLNGVMRGYKFWSSLPISIVNIDGTKLPVIEELNLSLTTLQDYSNLSTLSTLKNLNMTGTAINDLDFVKNLRLLQILDAANNRITDISPANLPSISRYNFTNQKIVYYGDQKQFYYNGIHEMITPVKTIFDKDKSIIPFSLFSPNKGVYDQQGETIKWSNLTAQDVFEHKFYDFQKSTNEIILSQVVASKFESPDKKFSGVFVYETEFREGAPLNHVPRIEATDKVLMKGDTFNPLDGVTAYDKEDGVLVLTDANVIENNVNVNEAGTYKVTYKVTDSKGASGMKTITVVVNEKMESLNHVPRIEATDKVLMKGDTFNPLDGVTAHDKEDGVLALTDANVIENNVNVNEAGTYKVTYKVTDSEGASAVKTITVTINNKDAKPENKPTYKPTNKPSLNVGANVSKSSPSPKTGDMTNVGSLSLFILGSIIMLSIAFGRKSKR